jgi:hypothetical protein
MRDIRSPLDGFTSPLGARRGFSPLSLVTGSTAMAWYDPSDLSTLFQDDAETVPVTASGQAVAVMRDKSGNGFHARQTVAVSRPIYTESGGLRYLAFDGSNDFMVTGTITPGADKVQVFAGVRKLSDAADGVIVQVGDPSASNNGSIRMDAPGSSGVTKYQFSTRGTVSAVPFTVSASYSAPVSSVVTGLGDISGDVATLRINGSQVSSITTDQGTGAYLAYPMYIGMRSGSTLPFNGRLYSLISRWSTAVMTAANIAATEAWINRKAAAYVFPWLLGLGMWADAGGWSDVSMWSDAI